MTAFLDARRVSRWFGGLAAVQDVDLAVSEGEIFGLIGPNGAGKTTLFNMLSGALRPTRGEIVFDGASIGGLTTEAVARRGLVRTFQNLRLFRRMTALENVMVGTFCRSRSSLVSWAIPGHRLWLASRERDARDVLDVVALGAQADVVAMHLSHGEQRRLEVARALAARPRLLLLDEPCAGLTREEVESLATLIRRIRATGVTVLLIEHDMDFVMGLAERIAVLDFGQKIAEGPATAIRENPAVVTAYLGSEAIDAGA